jgi:hypothetical protein
MQNNEKQKDDQQKDDQQKQKQQTSTYLSVAKEGARRSSIKQSMKKLNLNNNNEEEIVVEDVVMEETNDYPVLPTQNNNVQPPQLFKNVDIHEKIRNYLQKFKHWFKIR